ncbi:MAG: Hsp20/alpha crystallin family protein [Chloroflexi bacterium]|nr:Hsp20/alpha crystallin family protein [Chloroflexota bacterium]
MPTIIRKPVHALMDTRREILHTISWQVRSSLWRPPTDIYETDESFIVRVEIAGVREDEIEVAVENSLLRISGVRSDAPEQRAYYHQMEIQSGRFEIVAEIPIPVDVEQAGAIYRDGFLTVTLPKLITHN